VYSVGFTTTSDKGQHYVLTEYALEDGHTDNHKNFVNIFKTVNEQYSKEHNRTRLMSQTIKL
jgi:FPC/CPF motif-containing protein YcgG